jgi:hypothetical protein
LVAAIAETTKTTTILSLITDRMAKSKASIKPKDALSEAKGRTSKDEDRRRSPTILPKPEPPSAPVTILQGNWFGIGIAILAFALGFVCTPMHNHFQGPSSIVAGVTSDNATAKKQQRRQQERRTKETTVKDGHSTSATHSVSFQTTPRARTPQFPCTSELLADFVHDEPVAGFHILCFQYDDNDDGTLHLDVRVGGTEQDPVVHRVMEGPVSWETLKGVLQDTAWLQSSAPTDFQPWALFSPVGERLVDAQTVEDPSSGDTIVDVLAKDVGMVLAYSGGQFLWPGVRLGFKRPVALYSIMPGNPPRTFEKNQTATLETLSLYPLVLSVEGFLTKEECRHIQVSFHPASLVWCQDDSSPLIASSQHRKRQHRPCDILGWS